MVGLLALVVALGVGTLGWQGAGGRPVPKESRAVTQVRSAGGGPNVTVERATAGETAGAHSRRAEQGNGRTRPRRKPARATGEFRVAPGASAAVGSPTPQRFAVEVERGSRVRPAAFARAVERALLDPRSWTAGGGTVGFQRVDTPPFDFRVMLAHPDTADELCYPLQTNGYFSCRNGGRVVINLDRWMTAIPGYGASLTTYRRYVVNHEVGHALGHGHVPCPGSGERAPVMMQQTKGVEPCEANAWPHPGAGR